MIINVSDVKIGDRRKVNKKKLAAMIESIEAIGLLNPIGVINRGGPRTPDWHLVHGLHRLEAMRALNEGLIDATVVKDTDTELAEIDENLIRADLTPKQRADQIAKRVELLAARHLELGADSAPNPLGGRPVTTGTNAAIEETAAATNRSKTQVKQAVRISKIAVDDPTVEAATADNLEALASLKPEEQKQAVDRVASGASENFRDARDFIKGESAEEEKTRKTLATLRRAWTNATPDAKSTFVKEISDWLQNNN